MNQTQIQTKIEKKSRQRRESLTEGRNPVRTAELDSDLEDLYAQLRTVKAQGEYGSRGKIIKQARVERELEKLYQER